MISSKHLIKLVAVLVVIAVGLCVCAMVFPEKLEPFLNETGIAMEYEEKLFDTNQILLVNILMEDDKWQEMLDNAMAEEYVACDVEINGELFQNVGLRPKGNTSLSSVANDPTTDRYSFKLEFDQFDNTQNCYGLDKLILNNNYADNTNMKEALIYDMFDYLGADAPLYNYTKISVNGEYWGVYLALEAVEESFLLRNYGNAGGALYKPDGMNMGGKKMGRGEQGGQQMTPPQRQEGTTGAGQTAKTERKGMGGGMPGGGRGGNGGATLNYTDDSLDSYSTIWDGEVTDTNEEDHKRVVAALKNISEGTNLESSMDIDNLLKYMAVHVFSVNQDSLSGQMAHNYYLYEEDGKLNILPWDYNLALGGMQGSSNATSVINDAIDTPFSMTQFFDPLLENPEYLEQYHGYLQKLAEEYILGGRFELFYQTTREKLDELVKTDPNAFATYEEYEAAAETLFEGITLRGESVLGQVSGSIPATDAGQRENAEGLVDASHLDLNLLGSMHGGDRLREHMNP